MAPVRQDHCPIMTTNQSNKGHNHISTTAGHWTVPIYAHHVNVSGHNADGGRIAAPERTRRSRWLRVRQTGRYGMLELWGLGTGFEMLPMVFATCMPLGQCLGGECLGRVAALASKLLLGGYGLISGALMKVEFI